MFSIEPMWGINVFSIKPMWGNHARGDGDLSAKERHLKAACGAGFRDREFKRIQFDRTRYAMARTCGVIE